MTTVFAGLGGGEGVGASKGRIWPGGGGGPGWPPDTGVRDATARWLLSSCCGCGGTLPVGAPAPSVGAGASWLPPSPCSGGAGLASVRGLAGGFSEAGLLLCATGGASEEQADRVGTPVGASAAWDSDCGLSDENGIICESAGGACLLCIWSCAAPSGLPGPVGADTGAAAESVLSSMAVAWLSLGARGDANLEQTAGPVMGGAGGAGPSRADEADSGSTVTVPAGSAPLCVRAASKCAVHSSVAWASPPSGMALYWGGVQVGVRAPCAVRAPAALGQRVQVPWAPSGQLGWMRSASDTVRGAPLAPTGPL